MTSETDDMRTSVLDISQVWRAFCENLGAKVGLGFGFHSQFNSVHSQNGPGSCLLFHSVCVMCHNNTKNAT